MTSSNYAVLFRTHFWDEFAERQYQRLSDAASGADVFVLVDETSKPIPIPHPNVVPHTQQSVLNLGLHGGGHGNILWFNGDYPLYYFYQQHSQYDYYIIVEYDVVVGCELDAVIERMREESVDFVGLSNNQPLSEWPLTHTCVDVYPQDTIRKCLICISMFSNRAVRHLFDRRVVMSAQFEAGLLPCWPYCEAFIPTEIAAARLKMVELSEFGPTSHYDWKPAIIESDLPLLAGQAFAHPLLDPERFIRHVMVDLWPPEAFFNPRNTVARRLRRAPISMYGPLLVKALLHRARAPLRKLMARGEPGSARS